MSPHRRIRVALGWLVGVLVLYLIFRQIDVRQVFVSLGAASASLLSLSFALLVIAHLLRVFKWHIVLREQYGVLGVAALFFSSKAWGDMSPARLGEFAPLLSEEYRRSRVAALLLVDRVLEAYATLSWGALGILLLRFRDVRVIAGSAAAFLTLAVFLVTLSGVRFWKRVHGFVKQWPVLGKTIDVALAIAHESQSFRRSAWLLCVTTVIASSLGVLSSQLLFESVGVRAGWPLVAMMNCVAAIAALVAVTPWGLGIVEAPLWWLGRSFGLPPAGLGAYYVLARVIPLSSTWLMYGIVLLSRRYLRGRVRS